MFVNQVDHFLNTANVARRPESGRGPHVALDLVAQLIPLLSGAAVFVAALLVELADNAFGMAHDQAISTTLGIASIAAGITYAVFRRRRSSSGRNPTSAPSMAGRSLSAILVVALALRHCSRCLASAKDTTSTSWRCGSPPAAQ